MPAIPSDDDASHARADLAHRAEHEEAAEAIQRAEDRQEVRRLQPGRRVADADRRDEQREPDQTQREQELRDELASVGYGGRVADTIVLPVRIIMAPISSIVDLADVPVRTTTLRTIAVAAPQGAHIRSRQLNLQHHASTWIRKRQQLKVLTSAVMRRAIGRPDEDAGRLARAPGVGSPGPQPHAPPHSDARARLSEYFDELSPANSIGGDMDVHGIECVGLTKSFGDTRALDGLALAAAPGTITALLGANGSGKTTTVRLLTTLTTPDSGKARVVSKDVVSEASSVREVIGLTAQDTVIDPFLTGAEYLLLVARLKHLPRSTQDSEVKALLIEFGLEDVAGARVGSYSGGMRRRLDIASSLIGQPPVLFLDEPSTGLDPRSRRNLWDSVRSRASNGSTVLLTTQYLEEADALADRVVVLAAGKVVASGTPNDLKDATGGRLVDLVARDEDQLRAIIRILRDLDLDPAAETDSSRVSFVLDRSDGSLAVVLQRCHDAALEIDDVWIRRPSLDETFLRLTESSHNDDSKLESTEA